MRMNRTLGTPAPLALSAMLTLLFVGCFSDKQSLNAMGQAGASGDEGQGQGLEPGAGGSVAAGKPGSNNAGKGSVAPSAGKGGGSEVGGSLGMGAVGGATGGTTGGSSSEVGGTGAVSGAGFGGIGAGGSSGSHGGDAGSAGNPSGGVGNAGSSGTGGGSTAGSAGGPDCNSSTGVGCGQGSYCIDSRTESCNPDKQAGCSGYCATGYTPSCLDSSECPDGLACLPDVGLGIGNSCAGTDSPSCDTSSDCRDGFLCRQAVDAKRCVADLVTCTGSNGGDCGTPTPACPPGYANAKMDGCFGACVPLFHCGCTANSECPYPSSCDLLAGRCLYPQVAPGCGFPYDPGPCDAAIPAFAFNNGQCEPVTYGGCGGNENRFTTIEECLSACGGAPLFGSCTGGRESAHICLECGDSGGCALFGNFCAETCQSDDDCNTLGHTCHDGVCQAYGCE